MNEKNIKKFWSLLGQLQDSAPGKAEILRMYSSKNSLHEIETHEEMLVFAHLEMLVAQYKAAREKMVRRIYAHAHAAGMYDDDDARLAKRVSPAKLETFVKRLNPKRKGLKSATNSELQTIVTIINKMNVC